MNLDHALRAAQNFKRYRLGKNGKTYWSSTGPFVPNKIIPFAPRSVISSCDVLMGGSRDRLVRRVMTIDPHDCFTFQNSLRIRSLLYQIRQFDNSQSGYYVKKRRRVLHELPYMFAYKGKYVIWNGNHRTTAALLLGRRLRCVVYSFKRS
jgi:hypothetical protein